MVSCSVAAIVSSVAVLAAVPSLEEVNAAIARHAESLAKIKTLHVKVESVDLSPDNPTPQRTSVSESWKSGLRERLLQRNFVTLTPDGPRTSDRSGGDVRIEAYDATSGRSLIGWDPDDPLPTPLDFTKGVSILQRVSCSIWPRDPSEVTSDDWNHLLLEVWRAQPLQDVVQKAEVVPMETPHPDIIRFQLKSTENDSLMGGIFELDAKHGYLISKREWAEGGVTEVVEFAEFPNGIWLPRRIRGTLGKSMTTEFTLLETDVNEPLSDEELSIDFPQGARVNDIEKELVYLWGKGEPEKTFQNSTEFSKHIQARIRESQGVPPPRGIITGRPLWKSPLIWFNVVLIGFLAILFAIRRRYQTQPPPTKK